MTMCPARLSVHLQLMRWVYKTGTQTTQYMYIVLPWLDVFHNLMVLHKEIMP